jgi:hypothetical protein
VLLLGQMRSKNQPGNSASGNLLLMMLHSLLLLKIGHKKKKKEKKKKEGCFSLLFLPNSCLLFQG